MNKISCLPLLVLLAVTSSCNNNNQQSSVLSASNPFLSASKLPFEAPAFDKIKDADFKPAIEEGMKQQLAEIQKITGSTEAPTFENTILAMEKSGQLLGRVSRVFALFTGANTNPDLQKVQEEEAPKLTANTDAIYLDAKLFKRVETLYNQRAQLKIDAESQRLLAYYYQKFELAGAKLSDADKAKLKELNKEEASLSTKFSNQLLAAGKDLMNTTQQPALQTMTDRAARQKLFEASWNRAEKGDANDTRK
eukprot:gene23147-27511_t